MECSHPLLLAVLPARRSPQLLPPGRHMLLLSPAAPQRLVPLLALHRLQQRGRHSRHRRAPRPRHMPALHSQLPLALDSLHTRVLLHTRCKPATQRIMRAKYAWFGF